VSEKLVHRLSGFGRTDAVSSRLQRVVWDESLRDYRGLDTGAEVRLSFRLDTGAEVTDVIPDRDGLPSLIRLLSLGESDVWLSDESPSNQPIEGPEQGLRPAEGGELALRAFGLLDPRAVARCIDQVQVSVAGRHIRFVGVVRLEDWNPELPVEYLNFLSESARIVWWDWMWDVRGLSHRSLLHPVSFHFVGNELVELCQPDLHPRTGEMIVERFPLLSDSR
jgi:hypothetical protein